MTSTFLTDFKILVYIPRTLHHTTSEVETRCLGLCAITPLVADAAIRTIV